MTGERQPAAALAHHAPLLVAQREQGTDGGGDLGGRRAVDDEAADAVVVGDHRLGGAAGRAGDDRQAGERRLGVDEAEALDLEAAEARAARHGEDVGGPQPAVQVLVGDLTDEAHAVGHPDALGKTAIQRPGRAVTDQRQLDRSRASPITGSSSARASISLSWPLRSTRRPTQTTSGPRTPSARFSAAASAAVAGV